MFKRMLSAFVLLTFVGTANAALISQDINVPRNTNTSSSAPGHIPKNRVAFFDLFDDLGGTRVLESVKIELAASGSGTLKLENLEDTTNNVTVTFATTISLLFFGSDILLTAQPAGLSQLFALPEFDGSDDFLGDSSATITIGAGGLTQGTETTLNSPAYLALFTGIGQSSFTFTHVGSSIISDEGDLATSRTTFSQGDVNIIYTYNSVPATGSFSLMLLSIGMMTLRRFSRA